MSSGGGGDDVLLITRPLLELRLGEARSLGGLYPETPISPFKGIYKGSEGPFKGIYRGSFKGSYKGAIGFRV